MCDQIQAHILGECCTWTTNGLNRPLICYSLLLKLQFRAQQLVYYLPPLKWYPLYFKMLFIFTLWPICVRQILYSFLAAPHGMHIVYAITTTWKGKVQFYTGCTQKPYLWDFKGRLNERVRGHNYGNTASTKRFGNQWIPAFCIAGISSYTIALKLEKRLKHSGAGYGNDLNRFQCYDWQDSDFFHIPCVCSHIKPLH